MLPPMLLNICERMMNKDPDDRYQTAEDVAERLTDWLADRGQDVGDAGKRPESGGSGGVGSDVFRRFAASISRAGDSGSSIHRDSSLNVPSAVKSGTNIDQDDEPEIGLAPLEEEAEPEEETFDSSDSDTGDDAAAEEEHEEVGPLKSLFEETLEKRRAGNRQILAPRRPARRNQSPPSTRLHAAQHRSITMVVCWNRRRRLFCASNYSFLCLQLKLSSRSIGLLLVLT